MANVTIGRAKTVLVPIEDRAVISTVSAHTRDYRTAPRLHFQGPVKFAASVKQHLRETVLKHVNDIIVALNMKPRSFVLSVRNVGAASSSGIGISISGLSFDVSVYLAMLSCVLQMPIRQDIIFTGHVGSRDGDVLPVESLAAKCEAAVSEPNITAFVYPDFKSDASLKELKPKEYADATAAIRGCRGKLTLHAVGHTLDVVEKALESHAIVLASLRSGFFEGETEINDSDIGNRVATYLMQNNGKRFWDTFEENLLIEDFAVSRELICTFADYYTRRAQYPSEFGAKLSSLVISLPRHIRRHRGFLPLLPKDCYIKLIQYASTSDHEDVSLLHDALYSEDKIPGRKPVARKKNLPENDDKDSTLNRLLAQLQPDYIEATVTRPYDEARARYALDAITVENNDEFLDAITAFYTHMCRHSERIRGRVDKIQLGAEALDVLRRAFKGKNRYNEALAEARQGLRGGLRYIMDRITERLKEEAREKHILKTFKEHIDPLDFAARIQIVKNMITILQDHLPEDITSQTPERFAEDYEEIIKAYIQSTTVVQTVLRRL